MKSAATPRSAAFRVGAVAYDPKVVTIWEAFSAYFARQGLEVDFVLYSHYDAQVAANLAGEIDVAWNSPLAWLKTQIETRGACQALAMRDTDRDLTTKIVVRSNSDIFTLADLRGKIVAVGASDSPQATLIPLNLLEEAKVRPGDDCQVLYHNVMVGKHGDHVGGEREAAQALAAGRADAACVLDSNYLLFLNEGTLEPDTTRVLATTPPYDHCNFTALSSLSGERRQRFVRALLEMSFQDAAVRPFMEMEGLKRWVPGRETGYEQLERAVKKFRFYG
ncbi:MAG: phosphate/phosphite/phosphonate ABC transporter substrate-binding protein [Acidobacteria bacterium]|nr:phosphate/phosphite/phosphonate ABC transporter substrate-binding protein [Acidobacteriota bacterium]